MSEKPTPTKFATPQQPKVRLTFKQWCEIFLLGVVCPAAVITAVAWFSPKEVLYILLFNLVFFFKTLMFGWASDDIPVFQNPPRTKNKFEWFLCWLDARIRWHQITDHALTTVYHALVGVGIYLAFGSNQVSFIAALLFSFNPTNNQGSVWISGRSYVLASLGIVWFLAVAAKWPFVAAIPFLLLTTFTNAGFIGAVALFGTKYAPYLLLALPFAWWINLSRFRGNVGNKMKQEMITEDKAIKPEKLILAIKTFGFYTTLSIIPFQNAFYHSYLQSSSGSGLEKAYRWQDRFFLFGLGWLGFFGWYVVTHWWDMGCFAILLYCCAIAPFSNFLRMSQETAERYVYLPNVGLMFLLATFIAHSPILITLFLTMYVVRMWFLMDMYQDDYYLLEHTCLLDPACWFAWHVRAMKRWDAKSYQEACIIWIMAQRISPNEFKLLFNLATVCNFAGHVEEAKHWIARAEQCIPKGQEEASRRLIEEWKAGRVTVLT